MNSIRSAPARPFPRSTPSFCRSTSDRILFIIGGTNWAQPYGVHMAGYRWRRPSPNDSQAKEFSAFERPADLCGEVC